MAELFQRKPTPTANNLNISVVVWSNNQSGIMIRQRPHGIVRVCAHSRMYVELECVGFL
jgi:hypothetical protein